MGPETSTMRSPSCAVCEGAFGFIPTIVSVMAPLAPGRWWRSRRTAGPTRPGTSHGGNREVVGSRLTSATNFTPTGRTPTSLTSPPRVEDHLSYFVVLQPPQGGGALSVDDQLWGTRIENGEPGICRARRRRLRHQRPRLGAPPRAGDLVGGGWRWHRVDPVTGDTHRITYGICPSLDGDAILSGHDRCDRRRRAGRPGGMPPCPSSGRSSSPTRSVFAG